MISFDYCFFKEGVEAESEGSPILVMHDDVSKGVYAHVIPQKGIQYPLVDLVIQAVVRDIHSLGYRRVIIKDDQEESILAFVKAVKRALARDVVFEQSPVGDPQSNGAAERAVQIAKGMIRTIRDACEANLAGPIPIDSPLMTWVVDYAAAVMRRFAIGLDGRSSYQRNKGKTPTSMAAEFEEKVWYRPLYPGPANRRPAAEPRFELGCFLTCAETSNEVLVVSATGQVLKTKTLRRLPPSHRWDRDWLLRVTGTEIQPSTWWSMATIS